MTASPVALVQGANRGLGLAFVRILAGRTSKVVATCRNPDQAEELQNVPNVEILQVFQKFLKHFNQESQCPEMILNKIEKTFNKTYKD